MATPNYKEIRELLSCKAPFTHGYSMSAERLGDEYVVWSYRTIIARYDLLNGKWWIDPNKYSMTTSKQQSIVRQVATLDGWQEPLVVGR